MEWEQWQNRSIQQKYPSLTQVLAAWELVPTYAAIEGTLCRVKCQHGKWWVLKRIDGRDRAEFIGNLLTQLSQYQLTPPVLRTKYGDTIAYWFDGYYYLMPLIRGKECSNEKLSDISLSAQRLALFHRYAKALNLPRFQGDNFQELSSRLPQYQEICHPEVDKIENTQVRLEAADFLYQVQNRLAKFPRYQLQELEATAMETQTIRHGHYHCGQVIKEHRSAFIVHWEEAAIGVQLLDLSDFCYKVLSKNKWQPEYYLAILNGYQDILPLSDSEKAFLKQTLLLPIELERGLIGRKPKGKRLEKLFRAAMEIDQRKLACFAALQGEAAPSHRDKKAEKTAKAEKEKKAKERKAKEKKKKQEKKAKQKKKQQQTQAAANTKGKPQPQSTPKQNQPKETPTKESIKKDSAS